MLVAAVIAVYWPVHGHNFVPDDDHFYVVDNPTIHEGLRWSTVKWAFTAMNMVNWIPLTWLSHAADYQMFALNPAGHHDMNVFFHCLSACLLFWMLKRATGYEVRSFMVAALFALHPINVEAVAWVAERKTMLSMVFMVLAFIAYRSYASRPSLTRYSLVALMYALGLMAKSQIIMLPFLLLLWDYWPLQRMFTAGEPLVAGTNAIAPLPERSLFWLVREKTPLFIMGLLDAVLTLHVQHVGRPQYWRYSPMVRVGDALVAYVRYIGKALWPARLAPAYPNPGDAIPVWQVLGAALILLVITIFVLRRRPCRYLAVGWFWFVLAMVPMSGIIPFGDQALADRYAYQPFCGLFLLVCWGCAELAQKYGVPAVVLRCASVAALLALGVLTYRQVNLWGDDLALWSHALQVTGRSVFVEDRVGKDLLERGDSQDAIQHFRQALEMRPADLLANLELGFYEHQRRHLPMAVEYYKAALHSPQLDDPEVKRQLLINLGHVYGDIGDLDSARRCFHEATGIPNSARHSYGAEAGIHS